MDDPLVCAALRWYAFLASQPGWKSYAWHQVNVFAQEHPSVFGSLPELLKAEMQRRANEPT